LLQLRALGRPARGQRGLGHRPAEYFLPEADDDANQQQERQHGDANRDRHKQQAAGNDTRHQQPDCNEHDRKDNAEPDHARTPTPL
jgi:hypothetical protein